MTANNSQPIDPASCEPGKWYLVRWSRKVWAASRTGEHTEGMGWMIEGYGKWVPDSDITVLCELVRADEAQQTVTCGKCGGVGGSHGLVHTRYGNGGGGNRPCPANADYWREECEKAQTERDEAIRSRDKERAEHEEAIEQLRAEDGDARAERDSWHERADELQDHRDKLLEKARRLESCLERAEAERDELREKLNEALSALADWETLDADDPKQARFVARWIGKCSAKHLGIDALTIGEAHQALKATADRLESAAAEADATERAVEKLAQLYYEEKHPPGKWAVLKRNAANGNSAAKDLIEDCENYARAVVAAWPGIVAVINGEAE